MPIIKNIYNIILEALFPRSLAEVESLSYSPEEAWTKLPRAPEPPLENAYSLFAYKDERVSKLVWNIKYKNSKPAVAIGGYALLRWFVEFSKEEWDTSENIIVVPIPITQKRRKERGYNQCELLVDEMKRLDSGKQALFADDIPPTSPNRSAPLRLVGGSVGSVACLPTNKFTVCKDLLTRAHHLSRQTLKNREDRLESAKGIFAVNEEVVGKINKDVTIIVIDDVITTGSTMKEAMNTLKNAGFENVFGLSLAH